jgi:hypothetical protein
MLLNIADGEALPFGMALSDFDEVMIPGSPLHIYDPTPCVTRQIDFARAAFIQAIATQTACRGSFVGTQYHPEHTLAVSAALIEITQAISIILLKS